MSNKGVRPHSTSGNYQVAVDCPLTQMNNFSLQLGVACRTICVSPRFEFSYTNLPEVSPDSKLAFSIRFATFTLTVYDSFNYSVQPSDAFAIDPTTNKIITNVRAFGRFMNQLGLNADWDLGKVTLYGGVYRYDVFPQQSEFSFLRRWQYTASAGVRYAFDNGTTLRVGWCVHAQLLPAEPRERQPQRLCGCHARRPNSSKAGFIPPHWAIPSINSSKPDPMVTIASPIT